MIWIFTKGEGDGIESAGYLLKYFLLYLAVSLQGVRLTNNSQKMSLTKKIQLDIKKTKNWKAISWDSLGSLNILNKTWFLYPLRLKLYNPIDIHAHGQKLIAILAQKVVTWFLWPCHNLRGTVEEEYQYFR